MDGLRLASAELCPENKEGGQVFRYNIVQESVKPNSLTPVNSVKDCQVVSMYPRRTAWRIGPLGSTIIALQ